MADPYHRVYVRIAQAFELAREAYLAACGCDLERERRLAEAATKAADAAEADLNGIGFDPRSTLSAGEQALRRRDLQRFLEQARRTLDLAGGEARLCPARSPIYPSEEVAGTFKPSEGLLGGSIGRNQVRIVFDVTLEVACEQLCLVQVFHIEERDTGRRALPHSRGYLRQPGEVPFLDALVGSPPVDDDATTDAEEGLGVGGYVVDAPPNGATPCYPGQKRSDSGGTLRLEFGDTPGNLRDGLVQHFEVAAVCLDAPVRVLGSMRWFFDKDARRSEIVKQGSGKDWGPPSLPFQAALRKWLRRRGR